MFKTALRKVAKFFGYNHKYFSEDGQKRFFFSWGEVLWNKEYKLYFLESVPIQGQYDREENRHHFSFHIGKLYVVFGLWKLTCKSESEYDSEPKWTGIWFSPFDEHDQYIAFYWKGKSYHWYMPWQLMYKREGIEDKHLDGVYYDEPNDCTVKVKVFRKQTIFRRRIFHKLNFKFFDIPLYRVEYDFLGEEVGSRKGSWKGGTFAGSACLLHKDEPLMEAVKRVNT